MRKWIRNRKTRREQSQPGQEPLQPENASEARSVEEEELPSAEAAPAEEPQSEASEAASTDAPKAHSRGRRRRKKPGTQQPVEKVGAGAIIPAYSETEGPRAAVSPVTVKPGAPTGEAAELDVPVEAPPTPAPVAQPPAPQATKRASKGAVVLSVGLPGSGKTTWFKRKGVTPLSSDLLRTLLFDDPTEQRHQDLVFSSLRSLLRARMIARMPANYVDATNLSPKERRHWIRMAREFGYEVHAVYFDVPLETCLDRNRKRQRVVPEDVMQRMAAKLRPPSFEEGFAKIIVVRVKHRVPEGEGTEPVAPEAAVSEASAEPVPEAVVEPAAPETATEPVAEQAPEVVPEAPSEAEAQPESEASEAAAEEPQATETDEESEQE